MPLKSRKQVLLSKIETTAGVDSVPVAGTDAMLVQNLKFAPLVVNAQERNLATPYFGNDGKVIAGVYGTLEFDVEAAGSGVAGTAPKWGPLMKGCAMSETVNAGVSVVYAPVSSGEQSLTHYYFVDGVKYALLYARGSKSLKFSAGSVPMMHYKFTGLRVAPADLALPTPTLPTIKPVAVNQANTVFTLHGYSGVMQDCDIDFGEEVKYINRVNSESVQIVGRKSTGSVTLEKTLLATKNWYGIAEAGTTGALSLTHGTVAGNKFKVDGAVVQVSNVEDTEVDGIEMLKLGLEFTWSAGNDELTVTTL
ncbi:MAG: phage tail tube protein [Pseudomonadota bacterium]